jgi:hypothetical protein
METREPGCNLNRVGALRANNLTQGSGDIQVFCSAGWRGGSRGVKTSRAVGLAGQGLEAQDARAQGVAIGDR